ncbi:MAG: FapA family protein [Lachnospiraceae bacterium]|nr:FapA family protein [Lachnospiraceae bacterium]
MTVQEKLRLLKEGYNKEQITEIELGEKEFLDTSYYSSKEFMALQMKEIRLGMEQGLEVGIYAKPRFDWLQMEQLRIGLEKDINVRKFAFPNIPYDIMRELRLGMENDMDLSPYMRYKAEIVKEIRLAQKAGIDITAYAKAGYDEEQLEQIRLALEGNVPIDEYIDPAYRGISLKEIRLGLERHVNVGIYANICYNWRQMREIRLGLEHQVDVNEYLNPLYDWKQMGEIREGLEEGLNIDHYKNLMYTAREMKRKREYMLTHMSDEFVSRDDTPVVVNQDNFTITISSDKYSAMIKMLDRDDTSNFKGIIKLLRDKGIVFGIKEDIVKRLVARDFVGREVVIAEGKRPEKGKDGYYELFFNTSFSRAPKELEDGSLDYKNIEWFETVTEGQKLAVYHDPGEGTEGCTVTGVNVKAVRGKPLSVLRGKGFSIDKDGRTYIADVNGYVELKQNTLNVHNVLTVQEVTVHEGRIIFDGSVHVKGNVSDGSYIEATGDVIIDGMVEAAAIKADGDVLIKMGINGGGKGNITSKKNISVNFCEYAALRAAENVNANYLLNSNVYAGNMVKISGSEGSIIGGTTYATHQIIVNTLGNDVYVRTVLKLGLDDSMIKRRINIENQLKTLGTELTSLINLYDQLMNTLPAEERNQNEMFLKVENSIATKEENKKRLEEEKVKSIELIKETEKARADIAGRVYENVVVDINGKKWISNNTSDIVLQLVEDAIAVRTGT